MSAAASVGASIVFAALFVAPLAYFGELTVWSFDEPVSNLEWDEAGLRPQQSGGAGGTGGGGGGGGSGGGGTGGGGSGGGGGTGSSSGSGSDPTTGGSGSSTSGGSSSDDTGGSAIGASGPECPGGSTGSAGFIAFLLGSGGCGSGGSAAGPGSSGPGFGYAFAGFAGFAAAMGIGFAAWGPVMQGFGVAMWQTMMAMHLALAVLATALTFVLMLYVWATLGLVGGLLTAGTAGGLVWAYTQGYILK